MVSDDTSAVVGSVNLDYRSMYLHFECATYFYKSSLVSQLHDDMESTMEKCNRIKYQDLRPGLLGQLLDSVLRAFETLF